jgi:hypothetical protein
MNILLVVWWLLQTLCMAMCCLRPQVRGEQLTMRALAAQQAQAAMLQLSDQVMQVSGA